MQASLASVALVRAARFGFDHNTPAEADLSRRFQDTLRFRDCVAAWPVANPGSVADVAEQYAVQESSTFSAAVTLL